MSVRRGSGFRLRFGGQLISNPNPNRRFGGHLIRGEEATAGVLDIAPDLEDMVDPLGCQGAPPEP